MKRKRYMVWTSLVMWNSRPGAYAWDSPPGAYAWDSPHWLTGGSAGQELMPGTASQELMLGTASHGLWYVGQPARSSSWDSLERLFKVDSIRMITEV